MSKLSLVKTDYWIVGVLQLFLPPLNALWYLISFSFNRVIGILPCPPRKRFRWQNLASIRMAQTFPCSRLRQEQFPSRQFLPTNQTNFVRCFSPVKQNIKKVIAERAQLMTVIMTRTLKYQVRRVVKGTLILEILLWMPLLINSAAPVFVVPLEEI